MKHPGRQHTVLLGVLLALNLWTAKAQAENRALIITIGLGYSRNHIAPIQGPGKDAELAQALARQMGFTEAQITVLREEAATREAILQGLTWLNDGVKAGERALLYYSGHGTQVPVQAASEGCMAALVPVDARQPEHLLLADTLHAALQPLRQRAHVVLLVDACFSGAITKALYDRAEEQVSKYYDDKSAPRCAEAINHKSVEVLLAKDYAATTDQLVAITATAHNEVAWGDLTRSGKGSLFTQALFDIVEESRGQESSLTFQAVRERAAARIYEVARRYTKPPHVPQLRGNPALFAHTLFRTALPPARLATPAPVAQGSIQTYFDRLVRSSQFFVAVDMPEPRPRIPLGEPLVFVVRAGKDGYLNLLELEPDGKVQILFPNRQKQENAIKAYHPLEIPKDIGGFRFRAREPLGPSRILALVTRQPLNLFRQGEGKLLADVFRELTAAEYASAMRSVGIEFDVTPTAADSSREFGAMDLQFEVIKAP